MDRRTSFKSLLGKKSTLTSKAATSISAFDPYQGNWTQKEAGHLLRRTTFGPTQEMINTAVDIGLDATLELLFSNAVPFDPPVRHSLDQQDPERPYLRVFNDPFVAYGDTWVNEPPLPNSGNQQLDQQILNIRTESLYGWTTKNMRDKSFSLMPKLFVFWHNHFVVSDFVLPIEAYQYSDLILQHAKGNFKQLTKDMTINAAMLRYLNGNENDKNAPNENYARELLELFTVGKGDLAGPGDYTTFTEQDVREMAKILTGWVINILNINTELSTIFLNFRHSTGSKILSHRFNNTVINEAGEQEYINLIDTIFEQQEVALFISRKLYRYFLNYNITPEIEANIIAPMAQVLRDNNYEIEPAVKCLLGSAHFFSEEVNGCMIKNPLDFLLSTTKGLDVEFNQDVAIDYYVSLVIFAFSFEMDMAPFFHPDVAGWKAYYQEPQYYRTWINTYSLPRRTNSSRAFVSGGQISANGMNLNVPPLVPVLDIVSRLSDQYDPNAMIRELATLMFTNQLSDNQYDYLKDILIPGLPDFEWTVEYTEYTSDPTDPAKIAGVTNKLRALFSAMVEMSEFQLM